jgi:F0F1-type ATP synthase assembly protein I
MNRQERGIVRQYARLAHLAFLLPVCCVVGYAIGFYLDRWLGTNFLFLIFLLLGIGAGIIQLVRELNKEDRGR